MAFRIRVDKLVGEVLGDHPGEVFEKLNAVCSACGVDPNVGTMRGRIEACEAQVFPQTGKHNLANKTTPHKGLGKKKTKTGERGEESFVMNLAASESSDDEVLSRSMRRASLARDEGQGASPGDVREERLPDEKHDDSSEDYEDDEDDKDDKDDNDGEHLGRTLADIAGADSEDGDLDVGDDDEMVPDGKGGMRKKRKPRRDGKERGARSANKIFSEFWSGLAEGFRIHKDKCVVLDGRATATYVDLNKLPAEAKRMADSMSVHGSRFFNQTPYITIREGRINMRMKCEFCKSKNNRDRGAVCQMELKLSHEYPAGAAPTLKLERSGEHTNHRRQADFEAPKSGERTHGIPQQIKSHIIKEWGKVKKPKASKIHQDLIDRGIITQTEFPLDQNDNQKRLMQCLRRARRKLMAHAMRNSMGQLQTYVNSLKDCTDPIVLATMPDD